MDKNKLYDIFHQGNKDINFYVKMAKEYGQGGVLEIGSGTGRILLPIAKEKIKIDGLEPNLERFSFCKQEINKLDVSIQKNINILNLFSNDYKTDCKYSLIILPFRLLQEITSIEQQEETLKHLKGFLQPDGILIFDVLYPAPKLLYEFENNQQIELGKKNIEYNGVLYNSSFIIKSIDTKKQIFTAERIYEYEDEKNSYHWNSRYLSRYEAEYILKYLGFEIVSILGDFEMSPFDGVSNPKNMVFIVRNKSNKE